MRLPKTRPFAGSGDFVCPVHGLTVRLQTKRLVDEDTGIPKSGGSYMACPRYGECRYYVSPFGKYGAVVSVLEEVGP